MSRRRQHRTVFVAAGLYNLAWGAWVATSPAALYRTLGVPVPAHPEIAACLGMVIGLYGVMYLDIARVPEHGWITAAVGLAGKLAGPAALVWHIAAGNWPATALWVVVFNDVVWWMPFMRYLRDAWPYCRADLRGSGAA